MANFLRAVFRDSRGATAVEYGLILALLVVALMASLSQVAITTTEMWNTIANTVANS